MNLLVPHPNTEIFKRSSAYSGPGLWNKLPRLKNINNFLCICYTGLQCKKVVSLIELSCLNKFIIIIIIINRNGGIF